MPFAPCVDFDITGKTSKEKSMRATHLDMFQIIWNI